MPKDGLTFDDSLDASDLRVAIVVARFNASITSRLREGCCAALGARGMREGQTEVVQVPGCFELPLAAKDLAATGRFDAIICLGAIIRGDTPHFEYISSATANGIQRAALDTGVPVVFGVLTTETEEQAAARAGGANGHKGTEAALTAIEMVHALRAARARDPQRSGR